MYILYNPHVDDFIAEPIQFRILRRRALKKYGFLIDEYRSANRSIRVLIDGTTSGLIPENIFQSLPKFARHIISNIEYAIWKRLNGFGSEVTRVSAPLNPGNEVLIAFSYKAATGKFELRKATFENYKAVIFHLSHYFVDTRIKASNLKKIKNSYLAGDSDISKNDYFKKFFYWYEKPFLVLPFAVGARFVNNMPWAVRDDKVIATGSFHRLSLESPARRYADFRCETGLDTYHPVRKKIFESAENMSSYLECRISPYRNYSESAVQRWRSILCVSQKKYFSINIVDLYNKYKFAIVGEEMSGFPALGSLEAMACGCVLLGQPDFYNGLGLVPNIHYLPYDGDSFNIHTIIMTANYNDLKKISDNAVDFIALNYTNSAVHKKWIDACLNQT
jgi:hypothetical protein